MRIEVAGIIASGKTTFARLFTGCAETHLALESFAKNPFWKAFYRNPAAVAFETELSFLLMHSYDARPSTARLTVCDFSRVLDVAYSRVTLTDDQIVAFDAVATCLAASVPPPTLIVRLLCRPEEALRRIRRRRRSVERSITCEYVAALEGALSDELARSTVPVVSIDTEEFDLRCAPAGRQRLLSIVQHEIGRQETSSTVGVTLSDLLCIDRLRRLEAGA